MIEGTLYGKPISQCPPKQVEYMRRLIEQRLYVIKKMMLDAMVKAVSG